MFKCADSFQSIHIHARLSVQLLVFSVMFTGYLPFSIGGKNSPVNTSKNHLHTYFAYMYTTIDKETQTFINVYPPFLLIT